MEIYVYTERDLHKNVQFLTNKVFNSFAKYKHTYLKYKHISCGHLIVGKSGFCSYLPFQSNDRAEDLLEKNVLILSSVRRKKYIFFVSCV